MKNWLENLDTTAFEDNLKRIGFSVSQINSIKARVETYILPQLIKQVKVEPEVKPANGDYDNMIEELRARCILMPKEQTEHKFNAGLYWAIDMIKRYKEGKGFLQT